MERLRRYDIYAPVAKSDKTYRFRPGRRDGAGFVPGTSTRSLADLAQRVFDENHLDSEVRKGKRSGAFCATRRARA